MRRFSLGQSPPRHGAGSVEGLPFGGLTRIAQTGFVHVLGAQGAIRVLAAVQGILLARILGPEELGRFALLSSALVLAGVLAQGGIPSALSRYLPLCGVAEEQRRLRDLASGVGMAWSLCVGMAMMLPATGRLLTQEPWVRAWLTCAIVVLPLQTTVQASLSFLHGQARFPKKSALESSTAAVTCCVVVGGSVFWGVSGAAWGKVAAAIVAALMVSAATGLRLPRPVSIPSGFWRFAFLSLASGSFSTMLHTVDTLVLGALRMPTAAIGSYRLASLLYAFLSMVPAAAMHTLFPRLVRASGDPPGLRRLCRNSGRYLLVFGVAAAAAGVWVVPHLVKPLVGEEYLAGIPFVRILSIGLVFRAVVLWAGTIILAIGRPGLNLILLVVTGGLNLGLNLVMVRAHGPAGAAWATVCSEAVSALLGGGAVLVLTKAGRHG